MESILTENGNVQSQALEDLSHAVNYRRWLADLIRPHLGDDPIEIGSGTGDYAVEWLDGLPRLTVTEADDERLKLLQERFGDDERVTVRPLALPASEAGSYSAAVALNVMEHIEDDVAALRSIAAMLRPGGAVVLIVPAFPSAMSKFDRAVGHYRRYTRRSLSAALHAADLEVETLQYFNPVGLLGWYVMCRALGSFPRNGFLLRGYDRTLIPLMRRMEVRWQPPFGQSLVTVARTAKH